MSKVKSAVRLSINADGAPLILPCTKIYFKEVEECPR